MAVQSGCQEWWAQSIPEHMKVLWIRWSTDPQCKEKLSCCSRPLSHSCATCQSVFELLLRLQAGEQSFHCQLSVSVVWPFIINAEGGALTHLANEENFTELFCQSLEGDQLLLQTPAAPGERGLAEGCGSLSLLLCCQFYCFPKESTPRTQALTAHGDLRHQNTSGLLRTLPAFVTCLKRAEKKSCILKELKIIKNIQAQFLWFKPRKLLHIF